MTAQYVYGVTEARSAVPRGLRGVHGQKVMLVRHGDLAAIVSDVAGATGAGNDLFAHDRVLVAIMSGGSAVVPARFGTVLPEAENVRLSLARNARPFTEDLARLADHVEFRVKGRYVRRHEADEREEDAAYVLRQMSWHASALVAGKTTRPEGVIDVAFLVPNRERRAFERRLERVRDIWRGRVELRLLGPLVPYDFAGADVSGTGRLSA